MNRTTSAYLKAFFCIVVWGASFVATKVALQGSVTLFSAGTDGTIRSGGVFVRAVAPVTIVWLRFAMGVAILGVAAAARRQLALPGRGELGYYALLGFLGITFHQWLQSNGLVTAQATTSAWIVATTPVFIALFGGLVLGEKLSWWRWAGIGLASAGVLLVVSKGDLAALSAGRFGAPGDLMILMSSPNWALFSVLSRRGLKIQPPARMMLYVMGLGWLFSSVLFFTGPGPGDIAHLTFEGWLGVAFLGVFCSGLAYIFWYDALHSLPASQVGAFLYIEPLVTVVVAAAILAEPMLWATLVGGTIILLGVWLVQKNGSQ